VSIRSSSCGWSPHRRGRAAGRGLDRETLAELEAVLEERERGAEQP
jgi:hypothetical protein